MKLTNEQIEKYQNDPITAEFVRKFVNMMLTYGYTDSDMKNIFSICTYEYRKEIKIIVDGMNESHKHQWE